MDLLPVWGRTPKTIGRTPLTLDIGIARRAECCSENAEWDNVAVDTLAREILIRCLPEVEVAEIEEKNVEWEGIRWRRHQAAGGTRRNGLSGVR